MIASASMLSLRRGHRVETTDVKSFKTRGERLSGAWLGMLHGHSYMRGIYVGFYPHDYPWQFHDKSRSIRGLSIW